MTQQKNRRKFLARSGALAMLVGSKNLLAAKAQPRVPSPPVARVEVVRDTYFGETLSDPYRWMESGKDPEWLPFLKGQNAYTRTVLDASPLRKGLLQRIRQLSADVALTAWVQRAGRLTFFQQRPVGANDFQLLVRQDGSDRVLIDPTTMSGAGGGHLSLIHI